MVSLTDNLPEELTLRTDWFQRLGLRFDPYVHLEASGDPHLSEYTVNLDIFRTAWDAAPAIIFAPPGGGKTATRVAVTRTCWYDIGGTYPFPLPYNLGAAPLTGKPPTADQHLHLLLEAGTCALLTGLAFRPERLLRASPAEICAIVGMLRAGLPGPLDYYLDVLRETGTPAGLTPILERTYALTAPPPQDALRHFCDVLATINADSARGQPEELFKRFVDLVTGALGFSHILILIDGIDAIYENQAENRLALQWVAGLFDYSKTWADWNVFIKLFAPDMIEPHITDYLSTHIITDRIARIVWNADLLVELLRKRIFAASDGRFESLDAISTPALTDVERQIVDEIAPLPRVALQVTRRALLHYAAHTGEGQLDENDIRHAINWYHLHAASRLQGSAPRA
ncbi:MAG: hypothetical protein RMJ48_03670 [Roseiflexaceae bacterium]|nr:hypothetical protein [Roseiflexaceae bacterium]